LRPDGRFRQSTAARPGRAGRTFNHGNETVRDDIETSSRIGSVRKILEVILKGFVKVCRDETDARAKEKTLTNIRRQLQAALAMARVAAWVGEIGADRLYDHQHMFAMFILPDDVGGGSPVAA
jgi:hypothetical protein